MASLSSPDSLGAMDTWVVKSLWPNLSDDLRRAHYDQFLNYMKSSLNDLLKSNATDTVVMEDICQMLRRIRSLQTSDQMPRSDLVSQLQQDNPTAWRRQNDDTMIKSVTLCYSLRLALHISPGSRSRLPNAAPLQWDGDKTISTVLSGVFPPPSTSLGENIIDQRLTLEYLSKSYGYKFHFVDSLADHLKFQPETNQTWLSVYRHKIFLKNEVRFGSLLPQSLLGEALDTLNLLLPYDDEKTSAFLQSQGMGGFHSLGPSNRSRKTNLSDYNYFRDNLARLCAVIKDKPPVGIQQLMPGRHRSNLREFLNFWLAASVGVLTIFSIAFGIAALIYAKWAYDVALLQYQLSLAQACAEPDAAATLPDFC